MSNSPDPCNLAEDVLMNLEGTWLFHFSRYPQTGWLFLPVYWLNGRSNFLHFSKAVHFSLRFTQLSVRLLLLCFPSSKKLSFAICDFHPPIFRPKTDTERCTGEWNVLCLGKFYEVLKAGAWKLFYNGMQMRPSRPFQNHWARWIIGKWSCFSFRNRLLLSTWNGKTVMAI